MDGIDSVSNLIKYLGYNPGYNRLNCSVNISMNIRDCGNWRLGPERMVWHYTLIVG